MSMYNIIAVTNRQLCTGDFIAQLERLAKLPLRAILLREKDLPPAEYLKLAETALAICRRYDRQCILHGSAAAAASAGAAALHLPLAELCRIGRPPFIERLGVSVHSAAEAVMAYQCGADYLIAGHVFATDCKRGLMPRGLDFLRAVCAAVPLPVYAIGGITLARMTEVMAQGAAGGCMMSECMKADSELFHSLAPR